MTLKTRLTLLGICVVAFLVLAPYIVLYSLGYRINFETWEIKGTGGIYVYAMPAPSSITVDSKIASKTGYFSSAVFVQNLMPGPHSVLIKKDGYYDYQKTLEVKEKEVTKLENVTLFKQKIDFSLFKKDVNYFSVSSNKEALLTATIEKSGVNFEITRFNTQKQAIIFPLINAKITDAIWSDSGDKIVLKISQNYYLLNASNEKPTITPLPVLVGATQVIFNPQNTEELFFVKNKNAYSNLKPLTIIKDEKIIELLKNNISVSDIKNSANNQKRVYCTNRQVFISSAEKNHLDKTVLDTYTEAIRDCEWLNNDYVIISTDNAITISEIDSRGNINKVALPNVLALTQNDLPNQPGNIIVKNPEIFLRQQDKKLYIFTQNSIIVSERLVP